MSVLDEGSTDHLVPLTGCERIAFGMRVLGASYDDDELIETFILL